MMRCAKEIYTSQSEFSKDNIMLTCPCNVYPLTPHFYIVKLGFSEVFIFSYFCSKTKIVGTS